MADEFLESTSEVTVTREREAILKNVPGPGKALLILMSGGRRGERAVLGDERFIIGRGSSADMQLESDSVSRQHAVIQKRDALHVLVDHGSTNGSYVNYRRVQEHVLQDGDQILIGGSLLKYLSGDNIEAAYHEEFRRLVRRDVLTGALNQATFNEELDPALLKAKKTKKDLSLILFDLDHFKQINDTHGHTLGDLVLSGVGAKILERVSEPHLFGRVGGEEFAIVYAGPVSEAVDLAETLRSELEALSVESDGIVLHVTASFGVTEFQGESATELRDRADKNLYRAKEGGRNRVVS